MVENKVFLQAISTCLEWLKKSLGSEWPAFRARLQQALERLNAASTDEQVLAAVDEIITVCLDTPAADFFRDLLCGIQTKAAWTPEPVRRGGIPSWLPTLAELVEPSPLTRSPAWSGDQPEALATRSDVISAGRELAAALSGFRYLNTLFTKADGEMALPPDEPLVHGQSYVLYVDISPERKGLGEDDIPFPDQALDECWDEAQTLPLTIIASSRDFHIEHPMQTLALPRAGPSDGVRFAVRPLLDEGRGFIQVEVFYRGHLLQSKRVEALIMSTVDAAVPASLRPAQTARITFTTTARLDPDSLVLFPERVLAVDVERDSRDGSIDFRFLDRTRGDAELAYYDTRLQPEALGQAIAGVRKQLQLAITGEVRDSETVPGYQYVLIGDDALLNVWLPRLAHAGRYLYRVLLPETGSHPSEGDRGERLRAALQPGAIIQVNPVLGVVTIPWTLLYERELKLVTGRTRVCERFAAQGPDCADCPYTGDAYIVCPYAFWGYRYAIEQLPCWVSGELPHPPALVREIANGWPLHLNLNVWRDFLLWRDHVPKIEAAGEVRALVAEEISQLEAVWAEHSPDLDVVYFYSHGGTDEVLGQPYLELSDGRIDSNFLEASHLHWPHNPLVFLNGCATGDYGPESYVSLIDDFRAAGASGVVGTECPVPELFAEAYAAALFPRLFRGEPLGQAMLTVRLEFLRYKKNPLGLAYTLYAAHEITLARPVASMTTEVFR
jgi:hypothetical protein